MRLSALHHENRILREKLGHRKIVLDVSQKRRLARAAVKLEGHDEYGQPVQYELEGLAARVVQHELDHLDGVLIIDRTDTESRKEALGALRPQPVLR